jgi:hypothetical protein
LLPPARIRLNAKPEPWQFDDMSKIVIALSCFVAGYLVTYTVDHISDFVFFPCEEEILQKDQPDYPFHASAVMTR